MLCVTYKGSFIFCLPNCRWTTKPEDVFPTYIQTSPSLITQDKPFQCLGNTVEMGNNSPDDNPALFITLPYLTTFSLLLRASLWKDFSADTAALQIRYFPLFLTLTFIMLWPGTTVQWTATTGVCHFLKLLSPLGGVISGAFQSPGGKKLVQSLLKPKSQQQQRKHGELDVYRLLFHRHLLCVFSWVWFLATKTHSKSLIKAKTENRNGFCLGAKHSGYLEVGWIIFLASPAGNGFHHPCRPPHHLTYPET